MNVARILMLGGLAAGLAIAPHAGAQTTAPTGTVTVTPRAADRPDNAIVPAAQLEAGSNSYTEGQARSRLEANGFSAISNLRRDDNGFWRATATHGANSGDVAMDFQGRIAHGAGVASIGPRPAVTGSTTAVPSTMAPSTMAPSTMAPSTMAPSTMAPSTMAPSTMAPSTMAPSTMAPSTISPSTMAPSTMAPSTMAPSTMAPSTMAPSTMAPSTMAPSTTAPTGAAPLPPAR